MRPDKELMELAERIYSARRAFQLSEADLAASAQVTVADVEAWEEATAAPNKAEIARLAALFGCTAAALTKGGRGWTGFMAKVGPKPAPQIKAQPVAPWRCVFCGNTTGRDSLNRDRCRRCDYDRR
jgi:transcriptional regulator with XRE-family HTH domain